MSEMDAIVQEFLVESYENLDQLDRDLIDLEGCPTDGERLASVFRTIHTIKGTAGFFGYAKLEALTHVGENLLCKLREGELRLNPQITTGLLAMVDGVREILANVESTGAEGNADYRGVCQQLTLLLGEGAQTEAATSSAESLDALERAVADELHREVGTCEPSEPNDTDSDVDEPSSAPARERRSGVTDGNIRVDVALIDRLMNLVGELVLARNQILQFNSTQTDSAFVATAQRLNLITTELQEGVMKTRMQPIGNVWSKFPRVVRDLAVACGKQVRIELEGKDTELDKTIIEAIKDPLTHLVRNSVDHGIESPDARLAIGKPAEGRLLLRAFHEGGHVNIEISDDGGGIALERVKQKALERGLVTRERLGQLSEREALNLIFLPGFSTAEKVSNISGRGVGMDVVRTNIERIGGAVDLQSAAGEGTTLKIKIPLTLAIIPALVVTSGGERYAIPQVSLLELVRLSGEQAQRVERIHGAPIYRLRGRLLPLVYLDEQLGLGTGPERDTVNIVVLQADERQFGLVVDGINDTEEIVVKPLGKQLKGNQLFAGATIMGDGRIALILDVVGIAQAASVVSQARDRQMAGKPTADGPQSQWRTLLLLGLGRDGRLAIPLSVVARLEEIRAEQIESAGDQEVVQYRGEILPLVRLRELLPSRRSEELPSDGPLQVVVCSEEGRAVGLVVDRILDIVETKLELTRQNGRSCVLGSAVIQDRVTDLLDVRAVLRAAENHRSGTFLKAELT